MTAFVGPLALAVVFGLLVGGAGAGGFRIGVVDADGSHRARSMAGELTGGCGRPGGASGSRASPQPAWRAGASTTATWTRPS